MKGCAILTLTLLNLSVAVTLQMFSPEWIRLPNSCSSYQFNINRMQWFLARKYCQEKGGDLMEISSREEQSWIATVIGRTGWAVGLFEDPDGHWQWISGTDLHTSISNQRARNSSRGNSRQDCVQYDKSNNRLSDRGCQAELCSICETSTASGTTQSLAYIPSEKRLSWHESRRECESRGMSLAIVTTEFEAGLMKIITSSGGGTCLSWWIGLERYGSTNYWKWTNEEFLNETVLQWSNGEPNGIAVEDACAELVQGELNAYPCSDERPFICEKLETTECDIHVPPLTPVSKDECGAMYSTLIAALVVESLLLLLVVAWSLYKHCRNHLSRKYPPEGGDLSKCHQEASSALHLAGSAGDHNSTVSCGKPVAQSDQVPYYATVHDYEYADQMGGRRRVPEAGEYQNISRPAEEGGYLIPDRR